MSLDIHPWFDMFVLVSIGLGLIGVGVVSVVSYHFDISNAEPVEATIVHSGVTNPYSSSVQQRRDPNVVYEYEYGGFVHRGGGVYAGAGPATMPLVRSSRSVADRYEEGETVTAHVVNYGDGSDSTPDGTYLVGEGPRYYVYYVFIALGVLSTWAGISSWLYRVFGIDLPMRVRTEEP